MVEGKSSFFFFFHVAIQLSGAICWRLVFPLKVLDIPLTNLFILDV